MRLETIQSSALFSDLSDTQFSYALDFFRAMERTYQKGEALNIIGEPLPCFGLVQSGTVQVHMYDIDGNQVIMAHVEPGSTFGESLCYLGINANVYICAESDSEILWLSADNLRSPKSELDLELVKRFTSMLALHTLRMNDRIQVLSRITLRKKLITFFSQQAARHGNSFTLPLSRQDMAIYLGADRSALSRELSLMKKDGIIEYNRNRFTILPAILMED